MFTHTELPRLLTVYLSIEMITDRLLHWHYLVAHPKHLEMLLLRLFVTGAT